LGEHGITYLLLTAIKCQVLADFLIEGTMNEGKEESEIMEVTDEDNNASWRLFTDGASSAEGLGAGLILISPYGDAITYAVRLNFPSTNNEAEYEALLAGLRLASKYKVKIITAHVDSLLVANQVNGTYEAKEDTMRAYVKLAKQLKADFQKCDVVQISRTQNKRADALSKLASLAFARLTKTVLVEVLESSSIKGQEVNDIIEEERETWMTPIRDYLLTGLLPESKDEVNQLKLKVASYLVEDGILFKKSYLAPLLRCIGPEQSSYIIREVHSGICGTHAGPRTIVAKMMNLGYYWPTMHKDTITEIQKCESCQLHAPIRHTPKYDLVTISSTWPFFKWGMDILGPFPEGRGRVKFLLVVVDYFTKWLEVKPLATISSKQVITFFWEKIVCRYGFPGEIVTDNGRQFAEEPFKTWCKDLHIKQVFTSVAHP
jgi:ribonuclease HI